MDKKKFEVKSLLKNFKNKIDKKINIQMFILFGSRARGDEIDNSDIDILIVSNSFDGIKYHKRSPQFYLMWDLPYDIDILCLTPKEFNLKKDQLGVIQEAVKEGIEI